eukprot:GHVH01003998.1.p1 GENE.GHVH01003998.1~~GHVH01003998.1.p1  ORF type:complete len:474 (+),score=35.78 GHVH01003998.1:144-1565(+)
MPCLFAESMKMNSSLWENTISKMFRLFSLQQIRYDRVSNEARLIRQTTAPILVATILYLPICWALKRYYKHRDPFPYKAPVVLWNVLLCVLSAIGSLVIMIYQPDIMLNKADPGQWDAVTRIGVHPYVAVVVRLFCITKFLEYGDTFWLCVKKRPTIFLHLYHHITVTLYCLHAVLFECTFGHFFAFVNLNIHAVMYGYYAASIIWRGNLTLQAMRPFITLGQLSQMFFGTVICLTELISSNKTEGLEINAVLGFLMYVSYAYLFGDFFIMNYKKNLSSIDTLLALTPVIFLPLCMVSLGWYEMLFTPTTTLLAFSLTAAVSFLADHPVMSCLSPIYYSGYEASAYGVDKPGIGCMVKKKGIDCRSWPRMGTILLRFSLLPTVACTIDSLVLSYVSVRSTPLIFLIWIVHGCISEAWSVMAEGEVFDKFEEEPVLVTKSTAKIKSEDVQVVDENNHVIRRRTVPVTPPANRSQ